MSNFQEQVAASQVLTDRYGPISDYVVNAIYEKYGVHVPKVEVAKMNCVQVSTYANSDDYISEWQDEAVLLDAVRRLRETERLQAALQADGDSPEAREVAARLAGMSGAERIAWARSNNVGVTAKKQAESREERTPEETAALIKQAKAMPAGMRLAFCRKHNL